VIAVAFIAGDKIVWDELGLIIGAYLLGSLPFMYLLGRIHGVDLREYDDMHIALWRHVGRVQGFAGAAFDFAKGVIAVVVARALDFDTGWVAFAGVAAVIGQMWPVFMGFKGEKGNTTGLAMTGALATTTMFISLIPVVIGFSIRTVPRMIDRSHYMEERLKFGGPPSRSLPLGVALTFAAMPLTAWGLGQPAEIVGALGGLFVLILLRRVTDSVTEDMRQPSGKIGILLNRLLYDRGQK